MKKRIAKVGVPARDSLLKGANFMVDAVKLTLGPFALSFALQKNNEIVDDGVTVAREICAGAIHDETEARGARMMLEVATKTEERGTDGTSTALTLAQAITNKAISLLPTKETINADAKMRPAEVRMKIESECQEVVKMLNDMAEPIKDEKALIKSALVSTGNTELSELLGKTQWQLGKDGIIIAEETADKICSIERVKGIKIDNGIVSSLAINNQEKQSLVLKDIPILLTDFVIKDLRPAILNFNEVTQRGTGIGNLMTERGLNKLILVGRHFEPLAIQQCMDNMKTGFEIYPVNAPYMDMKEVMKDLAAILGGRYISSEKAVLEGITMNDLGFVSRLEAGRQSSIFTGVKDVKTDARIELRVKELQEQLKGSVSDFEKKLLTQRIAQLTNGFAILKVGSLTELDRKFMKRKADDAVGAVRSALEEGVVAGAGLAFKEISEKLPEDYILKEPLLSVHAQLMSLAPKGFKIEKWVKDPVKVLRIALEHACSVAKNFAMAGGSIVEEFPKSIDQMLSTKKAVEPEEVEL